jgi:hypothetical protein
MGGMSKLAAGALCDGDHDELVGDFSNCQVGGHPCWRQDIPLLVAGNHVAPNNIARIDSSTSSAIYALRSSASGSRWLDHAPMKGRL